MPLIAHKQHDEAYTPRASVRWDCIKNIDLKLQADRTRNDGGASELLIDVPPGLRRCSTADLFGAAADFVL